MGTTCASFHLMCGRSDPAKAVARAYAKLGYEQLKKPVAGVDKHVILFAVPGDSHVSVYDSTNADLDSGELKDAALAASKLLKAGAVMTSRYDSDAYEFVVFNNGRQVDLLMTDAESCAGPLKRLSGRARGTQWSNIFRRSLTSEVVEQALHRQRAGRHLCSAPSRKNAPYGLARLPRTGDPASCRALPPILAAHMWRHPPLERVSAMPTADFAR